VAHRVDTITQVESARVTRSWPDGVVIKVTERAPALAIRDDGRYDLVDRFGVVVVTANSRGSLPLFIPSGPAGGSGAPGGHLRGSPAVAAVAAVTRELPARLLRRLKSVTASAANDVTLRLRGGVTVVWGSPGRAADKDRVLHALLRTHAHYYDVSSPTIAITR
jgi:cell division protein FtsQ